MKGKSAVKEDKQGGNSRIKGEKGGNTTIARKISRRINEYPDVSLWPWHFLSRPNSGVTTMQSTQILNCTLCRVTASYFSPLRMTEKRVFVLACLWFFSWTKLLLLGQHSYILSASLFVATVWLPKPKVKGSRKVKIWTHVNSCSESFSKLWIHFSPEGKLSLSSVVCTPAFSSPTSTAEQAPPYVVEVMHSRSLLCAAGY